MVFMGHTGWRHAKTGRFKASAPNDPPGKAYVPVVENVDYHLDEDRPYKLVVISLWQPWASLLFRVKRHETRSFALPDRLIGRQVGIHAAKRREPVTGALHDLCRREFGDDYAETLPRGAILGAVAFSNTRPMALAVPESVEDVLAGDWGPGRHAWRRNDHPGLWARPIPWKGQQGFWTVTTDQLNDAVAADIAGAHDRKFRPDA